MTSKLFEKLRKGDTVVVWKLDRLGRSLKDLIDLITKMQQLDVSFLTRWYQHKYCHWTIYV
nr:recombinase family protein [Sphingobacterium sp.]